MTDRLNLAEELEAAEGPSRELDARIVAIVQAGMRHPWFVNPPPFTSSVNHALKLIPEGWAVKSLRETTEGDRRDYTGTDSLPNWCASLIEHKNTGYGKDLELQQHFRHGSGCTPALAIASAALKAGEG